MNPIFFYPCRICKKKQNYLICLECIIKIRL